MTGASGHRAKGSRQIQGADPRHDTPDTGVQSATVDQRAEAIHRGMARLLRLLPNSASPHGPRSVDPSKIAFVSLAAVANRAKPLQRTTPSRHIEVQCGGGGRLAHEPLANVSTPVGPTGAAQPLFRLARSSPNLCARPSLTRSNRRGTDPYARWCGRGGAARRPPIPISGGIQPFRTQAGKTGVRPFETLVSWGHRPARLRSKHRLPSWTNRHRTGDG